MIKQSQSIQWRRVQILSATFFCITLALISCKKKDTMVGKNAFDPGNLLNSASVDTFQLKTYTIAEDSVPSDNQIHALLGAYNDPKFGTVNASFFTQLSLDNPGPTSFGSSPVVDSIVLSLQYTGYYGKSTTQTFEVHEIADDMNDSVYYSFSTLNYHSEDLVMPGKGTITPKPSEDAVVGTGANADTLAAQLRIPLKLSVAAQLMAGSDNFYGSQEDFHSFFKGFYVKVSNPSPSNGEGGVLYFNLGAINSKLTIFYKNEDAVARTFAFLMNETSKNFNHLDFNRAGKPLDNVINNPAAGQAEFYAQAFTSRAVVEFAGVDHIPHNAVIHKAQLILPVTHYTNSLLYPSVQLNVGTRISATNDTIYSRATTIVYDDNLKAYIVDVRVHLQQIVSQLIANRGLFFRPSFFNATVERIIFNGTESVNKKKPKLVVTYTTY